MRTESFRDWKSVAFGAVAIIVLVLGILFMSGAAFAMTAAPDVEFICYDRSDLAGDLESCGAPDWAITAIEVVGSGNIGKGPVDIIRVSDEETAVGWAHFTLERDPLLLNVTEPNDGLLAFLYSDHAPCWLYEVWMDTRFRILRTAAAAGCLSDSCKILVCAMTNTSPRMTRRYGEMCTWEEECMATLYLKGAREGSLHRITRIQAWRRAT